MTGVLIKKGHLDTERSVLRTLCEHEGRNEGDASASQGMPKIAS